MRVVDSVSSNSGNLCFVGPFLNSSFYRHSLGLDENLPDQIIDGLADGHHGSLQVGHGVAVLALLVEDDELADLLGHGLQDVGDGLGLVERHLSRTPLSYRMFDTHGQGGGLSGVVCLECLVCLECHVCQVWGV